MAETDKIESTAVSGFDSATAGEKEVTVSYSGLTATFYIEVVKTLTGITVTPPTKTTYIEGQSLDTTSMLVTANYDNGTSKEVPDSDYTVSGFDPEKIGKQTVTVTHGDKTDTFEAEVKASDTVSEQETEQETKPDNEPEQDDKPTPSPEKNPEAENSQSSENSSKTEDKSEPDTSEKTLPDSAKTGDSSVYFAALCLTLAAAAISVLVRGKRKKEAQ